MSPASEHVNDEQDRQKNTPDASPARQAAASFFRVLRLARKELRESLRDRRTLVTLIVMPLIVYPLLGSVVQRFAIQRVNPDAPPAIVVFDRSISPELATAMLAEPVSGNVERGADDPQRAGDGRQNSGQKDAVPSMQDVATSLTGSSTGAAIGSMVNSPDSDGPPIRFEKFESPVKSEDMDELLQTAVADVGVRQTDVIQNATTGKIEPADFQVLRRSGDAFSLRAAVEVE
ncbi:MAG: hypothetical protein H7Z17_12810, partial [Fuerstia sp.]|nr:hypothetical protein [Fuerstiella sp.]